MNATIAIYAFSYMFLFKNSIMSTFLDFSLFLRIDTSSPTFENSLSDGTDVPETQILLGKLGEQVKMLLMCLSPRQRIF